MPANDHVESWRRIAPPVPRRGILPTIFLPRPRCPSCQSIELRKYRSIHDQGDGSGMSWLKCLKCETRFKAVVE